MSPFAKRIVLHDGLEDNSASDPARVAVVDGDRQWTYEELNSESNRLAGLLRDLGVSRGDRVGLYVDKSLESVIGIYGILKAGAAYVPLDPQAPPARLGYIAADCELRCLLTATNKERSLPDIIAGGASLDHVVVVDGDTDLTIPGVKVSAATLLSDYADESMRPGTIGLDLAYILYTSGSTGVPKGVMLTHENGLAFVEWAAREFGLTREDRLSSHAPFHFDLSIFDLYAASHVGAAVVLVPPETSYFPSEVARFIDDAEISVWYSVPSVLNMLVTRGAVQAGRFPKLHTLLFAGEVFPTKYLRRLMELLPHVRFCNLYGPTETNVCTWYDVPPLPDSQTESIPIGRAIDGVEVYAVAESGSRAGQGIVGELYVRGPTVMQGYWGDPERTARSLVPNPSGLTNDQLYTTGDLVIEESDGNFRLLGRRDHQIKSRGYRIELGDIESALYAHPSVVDCVVTAIPDEVVTNRLHAFVVARDEVDRADLMRYCRSLLPRHMVPETFEFVDVLPRTSTGKIDRQALSSREGQEEA